MSVLWALADSGRRVGFHFSALAEVTATDFGAGVPMHVPVGTNITIYIYYKIN